MKKNINVIIISLMGIVVFVVFVLVPYVQNLDKPAISSDTLIIEGIVAVFADPTDAWIEQMKEKNGEGFYAIADDAMYYNNLATEFLELKEIKIIHGNNRFLDFLKVNGGHVIIDRKYDNTEGWSLYLFDGKQNPQKVDLINIQNSYEDYFK